MIGSGTFVPMIDQVPELIQAKCSLSAGTAATAEPVSWQAGAMTCIDFAAGVFGHGRAERTQHGTRRNQRREDVRGNAHRGEKRQRPLTAPRIVALRRRRVRKLAGLPAGQPVVERSGMVRKCSAALSTGDFVTTIDSSW